MVVEPAQPPPGRKSRQRPPGDDATCTRADGDCAHARPPRPRHRRQPRPRPRHRHGGRLDVLVNNAGIAGPTARVEDIRPEDWDRCIAVDLNGMFYVTRKAMPLIKAAFTLDSQSHEDLAILGAFEDLVCLVVGDPQILFGVEPDVMWIDKHASAPGAKIPAVFVEDDQRVTPLAAMKHVHVAFGIGCDRGDAAECETLGHRPGFLTEEQVEHRLAAQRLAVHAADLGRGEEDDLGPFALHEVAHLGLVDEIQFRMGAHHEIAVALGLQMLRHDLRILAEFQPARLAVGLDDVEGLAGGRRHRLVAGDLRWKRARAAGKADRACTQQQGSGYFREYLHDALDSEKSRGTAGAYGREGLNCR